MKNRFFYTIFILFFAIIFSSSPVFAEGDLSIKRWMVDGKLLKNGDLQISEDITFDFKEDFKGVYRNISLEKIDSIENFSVFEIRKGEEIPYEKFDRAQNGDKEKYTLIKNRNILEAKIFSPSVSEVKTFRLKYLLKNVAIKQNDTGEFYYKFLGEDNETPIDYFSINLSLAKFEKDMIKIFAHGPEQGKIYFSDGIIKSEISEVPPNTYIENRILFPSEYIALSQNIGNKNLTDIISEEESFSAEIKRNLEIRAMRRELFSKISIYLSVFLSLIALYVFYRFRRNKNIFESMESPYPDDISPGELSIFMNKMITPRSFLASIFDLAYKGFIDIEDLNKDKAYFSSDYIFNKKEKDTSSLTSTERSLLDWLFNNIGDGKTFNTLDLEKYRAENSKDFYNFQNKWTKLIKEDLKARDYYDSSGKSFGKILILLAIVSIVTGIVSFIFESVYGIAPFILGVFLSIYGILLFYKTNDRGYIQYRLWMDFKEKIKTFDEKEILIDDDKALIYAIALDLPMKDLQDYRTSVAHSYYPLGWGYLYFLTNKNGGSQFEDTFNNRFYGTSGTTTSTSSGFGTGGGFTGGGGAGGGGAGGF